MTTTDTAPVRRPRGGRPRDPDIGPRAIEAVIDMLAEVGLSRITADGVATAIRGGKATLYRRWDTVDDIIRDAVASLGVRPEDVLAQPVVGGASLRTDLIALITAATVGRRADAERAILSALPYSPDLRIAYRTGPQLRLEDALDAVMTRALDRGDATRWPGNATIHAAIALIHTTTLTARGEHTRPEAVLRQMGIA